ncbi:UNVERIFIED_CONTAM: hypothetical protein HDU68_000405 [Siphonaria sp. JEL0065]|nr:hypothetical protein HDU68_000405 [Siphonaria sp. JEL0065]
MMHIDFEDEAGDSDVDAALSLNDEAVTVISPTKPLSHTTETGAGAAQPEQSAGTILVASLVQNPNKAGTGGRSKDEINKIIMEASKNSAYFKKQTEKSEKLNKDIQTLKEKASKITAVDLELSSHHVKTILAERAAKRDLSRVIVHVDMDAFYSSVEELDRPDLKGTPMAVGGPKSGGTLCTANYEARKYGVRSAMATHIAKKLCPELVILKPDFHKYETSSNLIRTVFAKYHEKFTPASLDEAYLDITDYLTEHPDLTPESLVEQMRAEIRETSKLTASAGIACNRMIAKVCSDYNKPNGQFRVASDPEAILEFMKELPIRKIPGIGAVSEQYLKAFGVEKCGDLESRLPLLRLILHDSLFDHCVDISLGIGSVDVNRNDDYIQKGIGREQLSFLVAQVMTAHMRTPTAMYEELEKLAQELESDMAERGLAARCVNLKLKNSEFALSTRAKTLSSFIWTANDMFNVAQELLCKELEACPKLTLRLIGIRMTIIVKKSDLDQRKSVFATEPTPTDEPSSSRQKSTKTENCIICFEPVEIPLYTTHVIGCMQRQEKQEQQEKVGKDPSAKPPLPSSSTSSTLSKQKAKANPLPFPPKQSFFKPIPHSLSSASTMCHAKTSAAEILHPVNASFSSSSSSTSAPTSVDSEIKPCPFCNILLKVATAERHIGICYVKHEHPDRVEEYKEYMKSQKSGITKPSTSNPTTPTKSNTIKSTQNSPSSKTSNFRCLHCNYNLNLLSPEDAVFHVENCESAKQTPKKPNSTANIITKGKLNHASSPSKKRATENLGIKKFFVKKEVEDSNSVVGEKRKRIVEIEGVEEVDSHQGEEEDNPYLSSQGQKYFGNYETCFVCDKEVPATFFAEHVNDHFPK